MRSQRPCVFCGSYSKLSKEHIWPEWMAIHLPTPNPNAHISEIRSGIPKQPSHLERRSERPGPVHTKKIRAICSQCNNGWMSSIETAAKTPLLRALKSNIFSISMEEAEDLATWAILKTIVGEHAGTDPLTPIEDRAALRTFRALPPYFQVFLARHQSQALTAYKRHSATLSLTMDGPFPPLPKGITRNVQVTTLLVGPLCFVITAVRVQDLDISLLDPRRPMHRIYPKPNCEIDLNTTPALTKDDIRFNSEIIERVLQHPLVKYGGERPHE